MTPAHDEAPSDPQTAQQPAAPLDDAAVTAAPGDPDPSAPEPAAAKATKAPNTPKAPKAPKAPKQAKPAKGANGTATAPAYTDFTYTDAQGVEITAYEWLADDPVAIVQLSHGIGEHATRYDAFAQYLVKAGFSVYADDHRGHGQTGFNQHDGDMSKLGKLGPGGLSATENAILQLTAIIRERHPDLPVVMYAHSWGSLMAQRILNSHPRAWDALVLSGSALRTFRHMESGDLNAKWAGDGANGFEWLSRDGGLTQLADAFRRRGVQDVTLKIYPGARHETLNETNRDQVFVDASTWMLERVAND